MSVTNKKFGGLSAFSRFLEKLRNVFVQKTDSASASTAGIAKLYTATGSNTDGSMTQKATTDALAEKIPYSGGELTGNLYITPYYNASIADPEGGQTLVVSKGKVAKGTNPSQTEWHTMVMAVDNTGSTNNVHKYGQIETSVATNGTVTTNLTAYRDTAGSTTGATIGISITNAGVVTATAPTPAVSARGTNIATAGFVDTYNDTYVITEQEILALWQ